MQDHVSRTVAVYDTIAKEYADAIENFAPKKERQKFLTLIPKGDKILDVGCAAGRDSFYFAENGLKVVGIDLSEELLKLARKRESHVDFQKQDIRKLKFAANFFDGIWACASVLHLKREEIPEAFKQFYKLLKPNGILFISVKRGDGEVDVVDKRVPGLGRHFTLFQQDELKSRLVEAGFIVDQIYTWNKKDLYPEHPDSDWIASFSRKK